MSVRDQIVVRLAERLAVDSQPGLHTDELEVDIAASTLPAAVAIARESGAHLLGAWTTTVVDQLVGHYALEAPDLYMVIRTAIDSADPELPSVSEDNPALAWAEREMADLSGVRIVDHPAPGPLVLHDAPDGVWPLRDDFHRDQLSAKTTPNATTRRGATTADRSPRRIEVEADDVRVDSIGPVRANAVESAHLRLILSGRRIIHAEPRLFFKHRGAEAHARARRVTDQIALVERVCGTCSMHNATAFALALERLAGIQLSERASWLRTGWLEIERIVAHMAAIERLLAAVDWADGAERALRARNLLRAAIEKTLGTRLLRGIITFGGIRHDLAATAELLRTVRRATTIVRDLAHAALDVDGVRRQLERVGLAPLELIDDFSLTGPVARASGAPRDVRRDHPYLGYAELTTWAPAYWTADALGRLRVWQDEIEQSATLADEVLANLPPGATLADVDPTMALPPNRLGLGLVEAPQGAMLHAIHTDDSGQVSRWHSSPPGTKSWSALPLTVIGHDIDQLDVIEASFGLCVACVDR